jgi:uncharacterized protein YjiS (DUF1127 family)
MVQYLRPIDDGQQQIVSVFRICLSRLQSGSARFSASWVARRKRRREIRQLQAFSDRDLKDIGLSRSDLRGIAKSGGMPPGDLRGRSP